jgi:hypothetical protein
VKRLRLSKALTIPDGTTVADACRRMATRRVDAALLTDASALLCGIITDKVHSNVGRYIGECMVSIINNGIKGRTSGYINCNTSQILISGGYLKVTIFVYLSIHLGQYHCKLY